ncbi:hypothetical protein ACJMK2_005156 [Sinanodonta woodiana]|uniref:Uncharacterized protein n=1 Tax=Sinanodonta woodiana TaxID=1069815 RepID=A0ABD3VP72_SINWO
MGTKRPDKNETNSRGKRARNANATCLSLENENIECIGPPHESINVDGITCRNNNIVHDEEIGSTKHSVKKKMYPKYAKVNETNFGNSAYKDKTKELFEKNGIIVAEDLKYYVSRQYRPKDLKISDKFISMTLIKRREQIYYQPFDPNRDNYMFPSSEQHSFNKEQIKEFKRAGKDFPIETGGGNIKSINLKIEKTEADYFVCSASIELHLRFELFKHIKESERLQVIHLKEGKLTENEIFVLKLNDINAHLEFILLLGTLGVTEKPEENNELEYNCIFLRYGIYIYKMKLYDFYIKFYAVIGPRWLWYDDNKKPQNPPDGDIVNYTIPEDKNNQGYDGRKGLFDYASNNFFKLCFQYFVGKHDLIQIHTTKNSDKNTVAEGTLALAMMTAESIRNHNTILINFIIIKLNEIQDKATDEYLREHPMLFGRTWPKRNKTGFNFNPRPKTSEREKYWFDQYQENVNDSLSEILMHIHNSH